MGFSFDDEPTVKSQDESTAATSGSHHVRRLSNCNLGACSFPPCVTRSPGRGRACPTLPGSAAMYAEGTVRRLTDSPTAKGPADIAVRPRSAGPAVAGPPILMADGSSSGAGSCRVANKVLRITMGRAVRARARRKCRPSADGLESEPCATFLPHFFIDTRLDMWYSPVDEYEEGCNGARERGSKSKRR